MDWTTKSGITIEINEDDCSLCVDHSCVGTCEVLSFSYSDGHAHPSELEKCNGCGDCVNLCPFMSITIDTNQNLFD
ncbi:MAG: 4Fe-4S binding protein [Candidatus Thorarchaeota archaeon]